jgi:hypothetical protein
LPSLSVSVLAEMTVQVQSAGMVYFRVIGNHYIDPAWIDDFPDILQQPVLERCPYGVDQDYFFVQY